MLRRRCEGCSSTGGGNDARGEFSSGAGDDMNIPPPVQIEILRVASMHGATDVRVFGSRARGDAREDSDLDLLVTLEEGRGLLDLVAIKQDLEDALRLHVDV